MFGKIWSINFGMINIEFEMVVFCGNVEYVMVDEKSFLEIFYNVFLFIAGGVYLGIFLLLFFKLRIYEIWL